MRTLTIKTFLFISALCFVWSACGGGGGTPYGGREGENEGEEGEAEGEGMAICGDGACNGTESCMSCPDDCECEDSGICGDGFCSEARCETCARCPEDCGNCVEVICSPSDGVCDNYYCGETCENSTDCGECSSCGDGVCTTPYECCDSCAEDCGACPSCNDEGGDCDIPDSKSCDLTCATCNSCGDGVCRGSYGENWQSCSADCGGPQANAFRCGNGVCEPGEDERCGDCGGAPQTCDMACASSCDCEQPWTACGSEIGGLRPVCSPLRCEICFGASQYCCWCPRTVCGNVTCETSEADCPSC